MLLETVHGIVISIHALHEESDDMCAVLHRLFALFQSTLSMRRATYGLIIVSTTDLISLHALHEESDADCMVGLSLVPISIHALHEESDTD